MIWRVQVQQRRIVAKRHGPAARRCTEQVEDEIIAPKVVAEARVTKERLDFGKPDDDPALVGKTAMDCAATSHELEAGVGVTAEIGIRPQCRAAVHVMVDPPQDRHRAQQGPNQ